MEEIHVHCLVVEDVYFFDVGFWIINLNIIIIIIKDFKLRFGCCCFLYTKERE